MHDYYKGAILTLGVVLLVIMIYNYIMSGSSNLRSAGLLSQNQQMDDFGPVVIVLSRGRSGSGMLCRVVANIVGTPLHSFTKELFGGTPKAMQLVQDPSAVMRSYLLHQRRKQRHKLAARKATSPATSSANSTATTTGEVFVGFKWKPYIDNMEYDLAYQLAVQRGFRFVFMVRNPLDEFISREKHRASNFSFAPHCAVGDSNCIDAERALTPYARPEKAVQFVRERLDDFAFLRRKLRTYGARFVELSYEQLSFGSDQERLQHLQPALDLLLQPTVDATAAAASSLTQLRSTTKTAATTTATSAAAIVDAAGVVLQHRNATMRDFEIGIEPTSVSSQSDKVSNYAELAAALQQQGLGHVLRG